MKKMLLTAALVALISTPAFAGIKKIGKLNGLDVYRIKTGGFFCPATTTIVVADPNNPSSFVPINVVGGPGVLPAVANAGGLAGAAALLRPARTTVNNDGGNASANSSASGSGSSTTTGGPGWVPPGHR